MKNFLKGIINKLRKITLITFLFLFMSPLVNSEVMENPFFTEYETNFKIPPFSQINEAFAHMEKGDARYRVVLEADWK